MIDAASAAVPGPAFDARLAARFLDVIEHDIVPLTRRGVATGDKIFGAALLRKDDLSLVLAETNHETANPLWHGEVHCLKSFYELPERPATGELLFLSTHEPCSLCLSAITWTGFDNITYLFSHEDSRDAFAIPHDLRILREVFGGGYRRENAFWTSRPISALAAGSPELTARIEDLTETYDELSSIYQAGKGAAGIPLA
ncbi:nucleoside deaminase [Nocardioides sp. BP30]|uniref:nucleoside deaminase n=1 Tax=Nocardioides sp. BP30 TaxID=3036374 RepID=UPI0024691F65|nr:nucleoside deaminase [Nocardioides sp. BP30]WGL50962.1 nucleoside deaminase [Nocardioides sp. BP30]